MATWGINVDFQIDVVNDIKKTHGSIYFLEPIFLQLKENL